MPHDADVWRGGVLALLLFHSACTGSPGKDVGATAIGTGVGAVVCVATLFFCPAALVVGAGGAALIRKVNVSRFNECMRSAPRNIKAYRSHAAHCRRGGPPTDRRVNSDDAWASSVSRNPP